METLAAHVCRPTCWRDEHHLWWPAAAFETAEERQFRNLPCHRIKICRQRHIAIHTSEPPPKPSPVTISLALRAHLLGQCDYCYQLAFKQSRRHVKKWLERVRAGRRQFRPLVLHGRGIPIVREEHLQELAHWGTERALATRVA